MSSSLWLWLFPRSFRPIRCSCRYKRRTLHATLFPLFSSLSLCGQEPRRVARGRCCASPHKLIQFGGDVIHGRGHVQLGGGIERFRSQWGGLAYRRPSWHSRGRSSWWALAFSISVALKKMLLASGKCRHVLWRVSDRRKNSSVEFCMPDFSTDFSFARVSRGRCCVEQIEMKNQPA